MKTLLRLSFLLLSLPLLGGCASGSGGAGMSDTFRSDMGRLLAQPLEAARNKIWNQYQIPLYRRQGDFQRIVYESEWMPRPPTPAEAARGVEAARNQIIIRGRRIEEALDATGTVYRVTFELYNQVTTNLNSDWHGGTIPDEVVNRYREVLREMEIELRTGVRR